MLDNAATASQANQLLEPTTRGAVLRAVAHWIKLREGYDPHYHDDLIDDLRDDPEFQL
jgi:hypothetical protein